MAPAGQVRNDVARLLARARDEERTRADFAKFLAYDRHTLLNLKQLALEWEPVNDKRAQTLLDGLLKSAEIYDYYIRAQIEHDPKLLI